MDLYAWIVRGDRVRICLVCKGAMAVLFVSFSVFHLLAASSALPSFLLGRWEKVMAG